MLGAAGAVGRACVAALHAQGAEVRAVGRDPQRVAAACPDAAIHPGLDLERLVAGDLPEAALRELLTGADVVVCCAGPSHRYSAAVARRVLAAGVPLVDPGGEHASDELDPLARAAGTWAVLGAGVQPGLSGLAVATAAAELGRTPEEIRGWCGGLQPLTTAGVDEYLHAATRGDRAGIRLLHHRRARMRPEHSPAPPSPFPASATAHTHLDPECEALAARAGAAHVHWLNVTEGVVTEAALRRCLSGETSAAQAIAAAETDLFGREPYFHILIEALAGEDRGWARVSCRDSYAATGAVAAACALAELPPGARLLSATDRWDALRSALLPEVSLSSGNGPNFAPTVAVEEGEL
ncbi:NAD(P)H-binding protein [Helcobacillus massiliensis]|uniref:NAD(P)H-binding protein n=1 Tax=Helcobacillus massiliensis TaxID=521392 RepID=UPI00255379C7|nr:NAD(P)H-binding protein [Helcobacillus massiliensis]MDK7741407.1 NAD(P)H-binding protein [Helcobacillus massiliensis]